MYVVVLSASWILWSSDFKIGVVISSTVCEGFHCAAEAVTKSQSVKVASPEPSQTVTLTNSLEEFGLSTSSQISIEREMCMSGTYPSCVLLCS